MKVNHSFLLKCRISAFGLANQIALKWNVHVMEWTLECTCNSNQSVFFDSMLLKWFLLNCKEMSCENDCKLRLCYLSLR